MPTPPPSDSAIKKSSVLARVAALPRQVASAVALVWETDPKLLVGLATTGMAGGALPAAIAYVAKLLVDAVATTATSRSAEHERMVLVLAMTELGLFLLLLVCQRTLAVCDALLRVRLSQRIVQKVLAKALSLDLPTLEDPAVYDRLQLAREHASERPLSLVRRTLIALQQGVTLSGVALLLVTFSPWLVFALLLAALPGLLVELRFNADAFRMFRAHTPEARRQHYLETLLTREDHAKELRVYGTGSAFMARHEHIFRHWFAQDRALSLRRAGYGLLLGTLSTLALGACLWWVTSRAMHGQTTIGMLAMLFVVLRQAQVSTSDLLAVLSGMHEDQLYLAELQELLALPVPSHGTEHAGPEPGSGIRFERVWFTYRGASGPALKDVTFALPPGTRLTVLGENGAGKTTLLKLLTGLYRPTQGLVMLDGLPLERWDPVALSARFSVMFQDFARYQLSAGENVGIGHPEALDSPAHWRAAARAALVEPLIESLPASYRTPLGQWFDGGRELSLGEWQRIALARCFTRTAADIFVLDEPTASLDPQSETRMLTELKRATAGRTAVLISHRATWEDPSARVLVVRGGYCIELQPEDKLRRELANTGSP